MVEIASLRPAIYVQNHPGIGLKPTPAPETHPFGVNPPGTSEILKMARILSWLKSAKMHLSIRAGPSPDRTLLRATAARCLRFAVHEAAAPSYSTIHSKTKISTQTYLLIKHN